MKTLKFCPECGKDTLEINGRKFYCDCGFILYHNVAGAVAVVIRCGDEYFFTVRNQEPGKGKLDLSGGFTDPEESAETTCSRELYEELQLKVEEKKLNYLTSFPNIYHYKGIDYNTLDLFFEYEVSEKFTPELEISEVSEGIWIPKNEIDTSKIAFESQQKFFEEFVLNH